MRLLLLLLFFLSGAAALIYEVTWTRTLIQIVGNTNLAISTVLAVFLLNFSLGSMAASKLARRSRSPLLIYAVLELLIGLFGLLFPLLAGILENVYGGLASPGDPGFIRLLLCWLVLSIPTFLMGATFPVINSLYIREGSRRELRQSGALYSAQTLGAAAGAALAGFVLIRYLGLTTTGALAAAGNFLVFLAALGLWYRGPARLGATVVGEEAATPLTPQPTASEFSNELRSSVIFAAVFCNAFALLALEVLWTRILVFFLGSITYSFSIMLVVFLIALGCGAGLVALLGSRFKLHFASGGVILFLGGLAICLSLCWIPELYGIMESLKGDPKALTLAGFFYAAFVGAALLVFPGTLLLGMITPLAIGIQVQERGGAGRESGLIYGITNLGACLGALCVSWTIIPSMGLKLGVMVAGFMVLAAGLLMFLFSNNGIKTKGVAFLVEVGAVWLLAWFMNSEGALSRYLVLDSHVFQRPGRESHLLLKAYEEGDICTASVVQDVAAREQRLYVDGFNAAATGPDYTYMRMLAHLPVMFAVDPQRALVIGYGTGTTAGSLSLHETLQSLEIVEISPAVMKVARHFFRENRGVGFEDRGDRLPQVRIFEGIDGRDYLNLTDGDFQLITLEPMMPYTPGAVHFYTREFYRLVKDRLSQDGVLCHWIPLNALPTDDFKLLLQTFIEGLPGAGFFLFEDSLLLLGFNRPDWVFDPDRVDLLLRSPMIRSDLDMAGFVSSRALAGAFIGDSQALRAVLGEGEVLSDDHTHIEYVELTPAIDVYARIADNLAFLLTVEASLADRMVHVVDSIREEMRRHELSARLLMRGREAEARALYRSAQTGEIDFATGWKDFYEKAFYLNPDDLRAARRYSHGLVREALSAIEGGRFAAARDLAGKAAAIAPELWDIYLAEAYLNLAAGNAVELQQVVEMMRQMQKFSSLTLAFRAELARLTGDEESEKHSRRLLEEMGGVVGEDARLLARCLEAQQAGEARYSVPSLDLVIDLLGRGPEARCQTGRRAWSVVRTAETTLLDKAKGMLFRRLEQGEESVAEALIGLGFFQEETVRERLRELFHEYTGRFQALALESLTRAGDTREVLEVLTLQKASPELLLKAAQIVSDLQISDALAPLINLLENRDQAIRMGALVALVRLTGLHFDFDPEAPVETRERSIGEWRRWLQLKTGDPNQWDRQEGTLPNVFPDSSSG